MERRSRAKAAGHRGSGIHRVASGCRVAVARREGDCAGRFVGRGRSESVAEWSSICEGIDTESTSAAGLREGRELVFHQAALGSVPRSIEEPTKYQEVNSDGTLNVLEAARSCGVGRVMFAASSSAYGDSEQLPKIETMPTSPRSPYAATKVAGEAMMSAYNAGMGLDTVSLRYFNILDRGNRRKTRTRR